MLGAIGLFIMGSLLPYLQLYSYRLSLEENNSHQFFSNSSPLLLIKTTAQVYICKDISKKISPNLNESLTYKKITNHCIEVLAERNDSLTYALLGRLNSITWHSTGENYYLIAANQYFKKSKDASPNNAWVTSIEAESLKYIQTKLPQSQVP
jgi:hypothetical protein